MRKFIENASTFENDSEALLEQYLAEMYIFLQLILVRFCARKIWKYWEGENTSKLFNKVKKIVENEDSYKKIVNFIFANNSYLKDFYDGCKEELNNGAPDDKQVILMSLES